MTREQLEKMLANASESVRQLNRDLDKECPRTATEIIAGRYQAQVEEHLGTLKALKPKKRIRQSSKPRSNKLETEFGEWLKQSIPGAKHFYEQAITVRLANGVRYSPDWVMMVGGEVFCYEVKGAHAWDDSIVKLKVAAFNFPRWHWYMAWKPDREWCVQEVLP